MDYVPNVDPEDPDLKESIKLLVDEQLSKIDTSKPHPGLSTVDIPHDDDLLPLSETGMNMPKMSNKYTVNPENNLELLAAHSELRLLRNKSLEKFSDQAIRHLLLLESLDFQKSNNTHQKILQDKNRIIKTLKMKRRNQLSNFQPINTFLVNRYNEKINELINIQLRK